MSVTVATFNIRKSIGTDRKRDPARILAVLDEIGADVVALQEADKRVGTRGAAVPHALIDDHGCFKAVDFGVSHGNLVDLIPDHPMTQSLKSRFDTRNLGWHGNAILVRSETKITFAKALDLPTLEPRGAVMAEVVGTYGPLRIVGMHLDLSGLYRRRQVEAIVAAVKKRETMPTVIMGDTNEWTTGENCLDAFLPEFTTVPAAPTFHSRKPLASLDRILIDGTIALQEHGVHRSSLARKASDHLPAWATLTL